MRGVALAALLAALATPLTAQESPDPCAAALDPAGCAARVQEDAWERLSRELHEVAVDPALKGGAGATADVSMAGERVRRDRERRAADSVAANSPSAAFEGEPEDVARLRRRARYDATLAKLLAAGLSWGEACPLAAAHAYGTRWLAESRRCVTARVCARDFEEFVDVLVRNGAPLREACVAAERYWNGLAVPAAERACDAAPPPRR